MDIIKYILAFGLGAAAGVVGGKLYFEKKAEDRADAEIDSVKRHYLEKSLQTKQNTQPAKPEEKEVEKPVGDILKETVNKASVNYNAVSTPKEEREESKKLEKEHPEEDMPMEPYEITEDEFSQDHIEYDKLCLKFYDEDEVLVSEEEELVEADDTIGLDLLDEFIADDRDLMYVRNNSVSTDYEVRLIYGNYAETMGIKE